MHIFTIEARQRLILALGWSVGNDGEFVDPQGRQLTDADAWQIILQAAFEDPIARRAARAAFPVPDRSEHAQKLRVENVQALKERYHGIAIKIIRSILGDEDLLQSGT